MDFAGTLKSALTIVRKAAKQFGRDRAGRMAAAVAYRTVFALAPLLIIAISVIGFVLGGSAAAKVELLDSFTRFAGPEISDVFESLLTSAEDAAGTAAWIGVLLFLWTSSSLFIELQNDLNDIFGVPYEKITGPVAFLRARGIGVLWVFGLGLVAIFLFLLNSAWRFIGDLMPESLSELHTLITFLAPLVTFAVFPPIIGLVIQTLTRVRVEWKSVWVGGLVTAFAFLLAAYGLGVYFTLGDGPTAIGFAGSAVVVLFFAYVVSSVFFFGAEITKIYSERQR